MARKALYDSGSGTRNSASSRSMSEALMGGSTLSNGIPLPARTAAANLGKRLESALRTFFGSTFIGNSARAVPGSSSPLLSSGHPASSEDGPLLRQEATREHPSTARQEAGPFSFFLTASVSRRMGSTARSLGRLAAFLERMTSASAATRSFSDPTATT